MFHQGQCFRASAEGVVGSSKVESGANSLWVVRAKDAFPVVKDLLFQGECLFGPAEVAKGEGQVRSCGKDVGVVHAE